jgi:hypothetical protein
MKQNGGWQSILVPNTSKINTVFQNLLTYPFKSGKYNFCFHSLLLQLTTSFQKQKLRITQGLMKN